MDCILKWGIEIKDTNNLYGSFLLMNEECHQYDCVYSYHQYEGFNGWLDKIIKLEEIDHKKLCKIQKFVSIYIYNFFYIISHICLYFIFID